MIAYTFYKDIYSDDIDLLDTWKGIEYEDLIKIDVTLTQGPMEGRLYDDGTKLLGAMGQDANGRTYEITYLVEKNTPVDLDACTEENIVFIREVGFIAN